MDDLNRRYERLHDLCKTSTSNHHDALTREWSLEAAETICSSEGWYIIHDCAAFGSPWIVEFMLEHGANPNKRTTQWDITPIICVWKRHYSERPDIFRILLRYGGNPYLVDKTEQNAFGWFDLDVLEAYLMVEMVCGEADNLPLDMLRVIKPFIYN